MGRQLAAALYAVASRLVEVRNCLGRSLSFPGRVQTLTINEMPFETPSWVPSDTIKAKALGAPKTK